MRHEARSDGLAESLMPVFAALGGIALVVWLASWGAGPTWQALHGTGGPPWLSWLSGLGEHPLWTGTVTRVTAWFEHQAALSGVPAVVLAGGWAAVGGMLLLVTIGTPPSMKHLPWWVWLAATVWLIWTHTPGGTVIPAVVAAAAGVLLSTSIVGTALAAAAVLIGVGIAAG